MLFFHRINSIRELCARCPLVMNEDTIEYLVDFKAHKDKSE